MSKNEKSILDCFVDYSSNDILEMLLKTIYLALPFQYLIVTNLKDWRGNPPFPK